MGYSLLTFSLSLCPPLLPLFPPSRAPQVCGPPQGSGTMNRHLERREQLKRLSLDSGLPVSQSPTHGLLDWSLSQETDVKECPHVVLMISCCSVDFICLGIFFFCLLQLWPPQWTLSLSHLSKKSIICGGFVTVVVLGSCCHYVFGQCLLVTEYFFQFEVLQVALFCLFIGGG